MINNFIKRAITGVLFVAILVGCILYDAFSFGILFTVISALTIYEFAQLVNMRAEGVKINKTINMLGGAYLFLAIMGFCIDAADSKIFIPYVLLLLYMMISELYLKKENPVLNWAYSMLSQLYIGLPFALLNVLAFQNDPASEFSSIIGKHRLFERISPKKSWEGSIGGGVVAIGVSFILAHYFPFMSMMEWAGLALAVVIFGTWGDLTESLLKRQLHVKDSGNILPGHGGMLDRFDSSLMAIPAAVVYLYALTWS